MLTSITPRVTPNTPNIEHSKSNFRTNLFKLNSFSLLIYLAALYFC